MKLIRAGQTITVVGKRQRQEVYSKTRHMRKETKQETITKSQNHGRRYRTNLKIHFNL